MVRKIFLLFFCTFSAVCLSAQQQEIEVRGRVVDDNGEPAIGAAILLEGADNVGVITDVDGNFSLKAPQGGQLIVSYLGYKFVEVPVQHI